MTKVRCHKCNKILGCIFPDLDWEHKCNHCKLQNTCKVLADNHDVIDTKCVDCITEDEELGVKNEKTKQQKTKTTHKKNGTGTKQN